MRAGTNPGNDTAAASTPSTVGRATGSQRGDDQRHHDPVIVDGYHRAAREAATVDHEVVPLDPDPTAERPEPVLERDQAVALLHAQLPPPSNRDSPSA